MTKYSRLTYQDRCLIEIGIRNRKSIRAIGLLIGRPAKTVSSEIKRNGGYLGYYANQAHHEKAKSNRLGYSKIDKSFELTQYIIENLLKKWSPEVIAGRWNNIEGNGLKISHESIYTWIYKQDNKLYLYLIRQKKRRGLRPQRSKSKIINRVSIHDRPEMINNRSEVGHYEADLMFQKGNQSQNILSCVERKSRKIELKKNESKHSEVVIRNLKDIKLKSKYSIDSITFDNGSEFANHSDIGVPTYFCDPASPWQKGAIENINGIVRQYLDYRINPTTITQQMLDSIADLINSKPRKILGFLSPNEMFNKLYNEKLASVTFEI